MRLLLTALFLVSLPLTAQAEDRALARIQKNQQINCGVYVLGSIFTYDEKGKPKGFTVDLMNEISERTGLSIKYTEISSFATLSEDLKVGHYDMLCTPLLMLPATSMKGYLPGVFIKEDPINIYADSSADLSGINTLSDLNSEKYTFVGMDGELGGIYVPKLFPKAKLSLLGLGTPPSNMMMDVHTKKANFVILSRLAAQAYAMENPGKLKQVTNESLLTPSVRQFFPAGSSDLKANIDAITEDLTRQGIIAKLLEKHGL